MDCMRKYYKEQQVDIILMSETNSNWISKNKEKMRFKLRNLSRNVELIFVDSQEYDKAKYNYLPGGIMNYLYRNVYVEISIIYMIV